MIDNCFNKRFCISKPYEGPPLMTPWGTMTDGVGLEVDVEEYDHELIPRACGVRS